MITINNNFLVLYYRYAKPTCEDFNTWLDALVFVDNLENNCDGFSFCIYDIDNNIIHPIDHDYLIFDAVNMSNIFLNDFGDILTEYNIYNLNVYEIDVKPYIIVNELLEDLLEIQNNV